MLGEYKRVFDCENILSDALLKTRRETCTLTLLVEQLFETEVPWTLRILMLRVI